MRSVLAISLLITAFPLFAEDPAGLDVAHEKRLPPVIPGEEVKDGNKTIKVWSTAGSVSVNPVPEAPQVPDNKKDRVRDIDVILDTREAAQSPEEAK